MDDFSSRRLELRSSGTGESTGDKEADSANGNDGIASIGIAGMFSQDSDS
jgi:hypothetical protein